MNITEIPPGDFKEVPFEFDGKVRVKIVATASIDCGVMDDDDYQSFAAADTDELDDLKPLRWYDSVSSKNFSFTAKHKEIYWLVLWNAYGKKSISVAYDIEGLNP